MILLCVHSYRTTHMIPHSNDAQQCVCHEYTVHTAAPSAAPIAPTPPPTPLIVYAAPAIAGKAIGDRAASDAMCLGTPKAAELVAPNRQGLYAVCTKASAMLCYNNDPVATMNAGKWGPASPVYGGATGNLVANQWTDIFSSALTGGTIVSGNALGVDAGASTSAWGFSGCIQASGLTDSSANCNDWSGETLAVTQFSYGWNAWALGYSTSRSAVSCTNPLVPMVGFASLCFCSVCTLTAPLT